jgi:hypothetical protein
MEILNTDCSETTPDTEPAQIRLKRAHSLLRRIDKRCWDDIQRRSAEQIASEFRDSSLVPFNFINRFTTGYCRECV